MEKSVVEIRDFGHKIHIAEGPLARASGFKKCVSAGE